MDWLALQAGVAAAVTPVALLCATKLELWLYYPAAEPPLVNPTDPDQARPTSQARAEFRSFVVIFSLFRQILVKN